MKCPNCGEISQLQLAEVGEIIYNIKLKYHKNTKEPFLIFEFDDFYKFADENSEIICPNCKETICLFTPEIENQIIKFLKEKEKKKKEKRRK